MSKLTPHAKNRPYGKWARNRTIEKATVQGLKNGDGELKGDRVLASRSRQKDKFNTLVSSWTASQKAVE